MTITLDPARCYAAVRSRDRRFDGRFFAGVVTTGVYCRPVCPVRPAKPENVRWFACAAAAEAAGFRPCRRCRPEASPGTPAWSGTSAVVARALRLIAAGALDEGGIAGLADRLGIGARQLRRLFATQLGAAPAEMARARRVHFARALLDETDLPMAEVAFAAGFDSIRDFTHALRATFGRLPTELRRARRRRGPLPNGGGVTLRLAFRPEPSEQSVGLALDQIAVHEEQALQRHVGDLALFGGDVGIGIIEQCQQAVWRARGAAVDCPLFIVGPAQLLRRTAQPLVERAGREQQ